MRTARSAAATMSSGSPRDSVPNSHSVGTARASPSRRSSTVTLPVPVVANVVIDAEAAAANRSGTVHSTRGTWKMLPALARTTLPLKGSTPPPARTIASQPAASAVRMMVPTFPGSFGSTSAASSRGPAATTSCSARVAIAQIATIPCGVVVSDSAAASLALISVADRSVLGAAPSRRRWRTARGRRRPRAHRVRPADPRQGNARPRVGPCGW